MTRPVRILLFSTLYPSSARPLHGVFVETRLRELLALGGVECKVVAPVPWYPSTNPGHGKYARMAATPKHEQFNGIDVSHPRYVVVPKIGMNITPLFLAFSSYLALRKLKRDGFDFDVIDAHYYYPDGVAAALMGRWFKKPVTITARGTDVNLFPDFRWPGALVRWASRQASASIGVSAALVERMKQVGMPPEKMHVMRNGVDLQRFQQLPRQAMREQLGVQGSPVLLTVGNLHEHKGQQLVLEAFAQLRSRHPGYLQSSLYIVGQGPDRAQLLRRAAELNLADQVHLVGTVPNAELARWYSAADVLLLASSREGWPNVLLEAMACGTPVVATRVGGVPEIVQTPLVGHVVDKRTPDALAQAVEALLHPQRPALSGVANTVTAGDDAELRRSQIRAYAQGFGWERTSRDQLALFQSLASIG